MYNFVNKSLIWSQYNNKTIYYYSNPMKIRWRRHFWVKKVYRCLSGVWCKHCTIDKKLEV